MFVSSADGATALRQSDAELDEIRRDLLSQRAPVENCHNGTNIRSSARICDDTPPQEPTT
jgi:hypothetical protein